MLLEKEYLSMEIQQISLKNRSTSVFFQKFCQWIVKFSSTKEATLQSEICTVKI